MFTAWLLLIPHLADVSYVPERESGCIPAVVTTARRRETASCRMWEILAREEVPIHQIGQSIQAQGQVTFRPPEIADGEAMWRIASGLGTLDLNSPYAYLLVCRDFSATSAVAVDDGQVVGFLSGYRPPRSPSTFFVWQVGVAESHQGAGIAKRMAASILARPEMSDVQFVEATVSPGNLASQRLFTSLASRLGTVCEVSPLFPSSLFPDPAHEDEELHRIGPILSPTNAGH